MKNYKNILKYLLFFIAGVGLLYLLFRDVDWESMKKSFQNIKYEILLICFVINIFSHYIRAIRWNMLINGMGFKTSPLKSFVSVMVGYFANLALPRMGEVSRCVVLNKTNKIPIDKLVGTVVTERIVDVLSLLVLLLLNFILEFNKLNTFFQEKVLNKSAKTDTQTIQEAGFLSKEMLMIVIIGLLISVGVGFVLYIRFKHSILGKKIIGSVLNFWDGLLSIKKLSNPWLFVGYTFLLWLCYYLTVYICFFALSITDGLSPLAGLTVLVLGSFGFVAPVQGGIGVYHAAVMQALILYGLTSEQGLAFAFVAHSFQTLATITIGAVCFFSVSFLIPKEQPLVPIKPTETNEEFTEYKG